MQARFGGERLEKCSESNSLAAYPTYIYEYFHQRTATERINALAVDLGIERPRLRNGAAIANQNTLIYILLNLRALHRVQQKKAACAAS
jgi:hypothetical protein